MYLIMKKILLLVISTSLKIAVVLANSIHFTFLCICKIVADIFQVSETLTLNDSLSVKDNCKALPQSQRSKVSIFTQTEKEVQQLDNVVKSGTDVIIYNLNSSQKLVITKGENKRTHCERCKSSVETSSSEENEDAIDAPSVGFQGSNSSYMSIESDIIYSKIESGCGSSSDNTGEKASLNFDHDGLQLEDNQDLCNKTLSDNYKNENVDSESNVNVSNDRFSISENCNTFEWLEENVSDNTFMKTGGTTLHTQKTSSPLKKHFDCSQTRTNLSVMNNDQQSQISLMNNTRILNDNWNIDTLNKNSKRRLSLPVRLNISDINFKLAQMTLIEDALKNTSRHDKSANEIKYPFSSEISLDSKPNDIEDKEVFSCSSYESLPVSDHIRNTFESNTSVDLCNINFSNRNHPDFSCVDNLVDEFNDVKSSLSVANLTQKTKSSDALLTNKLTENFQQSSFHGNSSDGQMSKDYSELLDNSKNNPIDSEISKMFNNLECEIVKSSNTYMCKLLDKIVADGNEHFSKILSTFKEELKNCSGSGLENEFTPPTIEENESVDSVNFYLEGENENDEKKFICSPTHDQNTNVSDSLQFKALTQSYNKIAFIDESISNDTSYSSQNTSKELYQDDILKEVKETSRFGENNSQQRIFVDKHGDCKLVQICQKKNEVCTNQIVSHKADHNENSENSLNEAGKLTKLEENSSSSNSDSENSVVSVKEEIVAGD